MSNIIVPFERKLVPIPDLIRLVLGFIYDKKNSKHSGKEVERFIMEWFDWVKKEKDKCRDLYGKEYIDSDIRPVGTKGTEVDEAEFWIMWCSQRLVQDEEHIGEVARNKRNIIEHGLDYRKIYRLEGSVSAKDMAKAMYWLKKTMKEHPEEYS